MARDLMQLQVWRQPNWRGVHSTVSSILQQLTTVTSRVKPGPGNACAHLIAKANSLTLIKPLSRQRLESLPMAF